MISDARKDQGHIYLQKTEDDLLPNVILIRGEKRGFQQFERTPREFILGLQVFRYVSH